MLEAARFAYQSGPANDRFDRTTILLYPGTHLIDNRPGLSVKQNGNAAQYFDINETVVSGDIELTNNSVFDLNNQNNILYKFNSVSGGVIVPKGTSVVGLDLRKTKIKPLYVPDPLDNTVPRSAIFNVTGGCYFCNSVSLMVIDQYITIRTSHKRQVLPSLTINSLVLNTLMV